MSFQGLKRRKEGVCMLTWRWYGVNEREMIGFKRAEGGGCHVPERCNATRPHAAPLNAISSHVHTPV